MQLQWTKPAVNDLDKIEEYISEENSPIVAIDIVFKVIETVEMILPGHPKAGRMGRVIATRELVIDSAPFIVVYRESGPDHVQILRALHDSQQWHSAE